MSLLCPSFEGAVHLEHSTSLYAGFLVASGLGASPRQPSRFSPCSGVESWSSYPYCAPRWRAQRFTANLCMLASLLLRGSDPVHDSSLEFPLALRALGSSHDRLLPTVPHDGEHSLPVAYPPSHARAVCGGRFWLPARPLTLRTRDVVASPGLTPCAVICPMPCAATF
jgi:hypothetical protein